MRGWVAGCALGFTLWVIPSEVAAAETPGTLFGWGFGATGSGTVPALIGPVLQTSAGWQYSLAVGPSGNLISWGAAPAVPGGLPVLKAVAAGRFHGLGLGTNGLVYSWGDTDNAVPIGLNNVVAIAAGESHSLALRANGTVVAWGRSDSGQAAVPVGLSGVKSIAAGAQHSLALLQNGRVVGWGGLPGAAVPGTALGGITAISAGETHSLALRSDGRVLAWGQFGTPQIAVPINLSGVVAIAAGGPASLAVLADGTVRAWGDETYSQPNVPGGLSNILKVSGGAYHFLAIRVDPPVITSQPTNVSLLIGDTATFTVGATGTSPLLYQWTLNTTNLPGATNTTLTIPDVQPANAGVYGVRIQNEARLVTSSNATLAVRVPPVITQHPQDLTVGETSPAEFRVFVTGNDLRFLWRKENDHFLTTFNNSYRIPSARLSDAGRYDVIITNSHGAVTSSVANLVVKPIPSISQHPASREAFPGTPVRFSVQATHAESFQWLKNGSPIPGATQSQLTLNPVSNADPGSYSAVVSNAWGGVFSLSATLSLLSPASFSEVIGWGESEFWNGTEFVSPRPPSGLSGIVRVAAGHHHGLALRANGTVIGWGNVAAGEAFVPDGLNLVTDIAAGDGFSLALRSDGSVLGWGRNDLNQRQIPAQATDIKWIRAGRSHVVAQKLNGTVVAWGSNDHGESAVPGSVAGAVDLAAGHGFNIAILPNRTVVGWGRNDFGQRRPPTGLSNVVQVAAGRAHAIALRQDGSVVAWGENSSGQTAVPPMQGPAVAIAAGADHSMALLLSGSVMVWGKNNSGQTEVPAESQGVIAVGGAGDQCVALRRLGLKFAPPRVAGSALRLTLLSMDGMPFDPSRAARVSVHATSDLTLPFLQWTLLPAPSLTESGELRLLDAIPTAAGGRFYRAFEQQ